MGKIQIELSEAEYCLLLNDHIINEAFIELLESFVSDGEYCHVAATQEEVSDLIHHIDVAVAEITDKRVQKEFKKLGKYLNSL